MLRKISLTFVFLVIFSFTIFAQQRLIMIGGGDRTPDVLARMIELSGGETGNILVITWASGVPQESFDSFEKDVEKMSKIKLIKAPFRPLDETGKAGFLQQLRETKGIFFGGGDQTRIMEVLKDETIRKALMEKYNSGTLFSGSSAGTAIMSEKMITGEGDFKVIDGEKVDVKPGLGFLTEAIVDQHFIVRQRQNRLMGLIWKYPNLLGIGIDEDTAFYIKDNRFAEVLGVSKVMILDAKKEPMKVLLLKSGDKFDLKKRKKI
jgi:cyanophycinase